jgi:pimeloyl-ACP methyl ester carboxylesterase
MTEDVRHGPIVLVPGIQGRWEWVSPAVRALSRDRPVLSVSLNAVRAPGLFDRWTEHIDSLLDQSQAARGALVGVSFGGLIAAYYAARRPERVTRLILVSAPSPRWQIDEQSMRYARKPRLSLPRFAWRAIGRLSPEIATALPTTAARVGFAVRYVFRVVRFPPSPARMADCVAEWTRTDLLGACEAIALPTLIITGEPELDRVVPVASSLEYLTLIHGARHATLARTGHIGLVSRPSEFARLVTDFIDSDADAAAADRGRPYGVFYDGAFEPARTSRPA